MPRGASRSGRLRTSTRGAGAGEAGLVPSAELEGSSTMVTGTAASRTCTQENRPGAAAPT